MLWGAAQHDPEKLYREEYMELPYDQYLHVLACGKNLELGETVRVRFFGVHGKRLYFYKGSESRRIDASIPQLLRLSVKDGEKYLQTLVELVKGL